MNQDKDLIIKEEKDIFDAISNQSLMQIEDYRVQIINLNENLDNFR